MLNLRCIEASGLWDILGERIERQTSRSMASNEKTTATIFRLWHSNDQNYRSHPRANAECWT
jgi:hypothetical protein